MADPEAGWINHGSLSVVLEGGDAELWSYEDENGVCAALPRWSGNTACAYGVICLGRQTGKVCYWDNPSGDCFDRGPVPIDSFLAGAALATNGQGICSDCHAGENPFAAGFGDPVWGDFRATRNVFADTWPSHIVDPSWPANPGPLPQLSPAPPDEESCNECHSGDRNDPDFAGRFPLITNNLPFYCSNILAEAQTLGMPVVAGPTHYDALLSLCDQEYDGGTFVPPSEFSLEVLSPPDAGPYYACANKIGISSVIRGGTVIGQIVRADDVIETFGDEASDTSTRVEIHLENALEEGDIVRVWQTEGTLSSDVVTVPVVSYPGSLPPALFEQTPLYECAYEFVSETIPGAKIRVRRTDSSGDTFYNYETAWPRTSIEAPPSWIDGETIEVMQYLCALDSDGSEPVTETVTAPPASVPSLKVSPVGEILETQPILNIVGHTQGASLRGPSTFLNPSVGWSPALYGVDAEALAGAIPTTGSSLTISQDLCESPSKSSSFQVIACTPGNLEAKILRPTPGDMSVVFTNYVDGSIANAYDVFNTHIGRGPIGGSEDNRLNLVRPLIGGELIRVFLELPGCQGNNFIISVLGI